MKGKTRNWMIAEDLTMIPSGPRKFDCYSVKGYGMQNIQGTYCTLSIQNLYPGCVQVWNYVTHHSTFSISHFYNDYWKCYSTVWDDLKHLGYPFCMYLQINFTKCHKNSRMKKSNVACHVLYQLLIKKNLIRDLLYL